MAQPRNADELRQLIEADELADQAELAAQGLAKMSVREYAKARRMQPQLVYYYIRTGKIKDENCICGRKVIDVQSADDFFKSKEKSDPRRPDNA